MSAPAIPAATTKVTPGRFLACATGGALALNFVSNQMGSIPAAIRSFSLGPISGTGLVLAAAVLLGAAGGNMAYNAIAGD